MSEFCLFTQICEMKKIQTFWISELIFLNGPPQQVSLSFQKRHESSSIPCSTETNKPFYSLLKLFIKKCTHTVCCLPDKLSWHWPRPPYLGETTRSFVSFTPMSCDLRVGLILIPERHQTETFLRKFRTNGSAQLHFSLSADEEHVYSTRPTCPVPYDVPTRTPVISETFFLLFLTQIMFSFSKYWRDCESQRSMSLKSECKENIRILRFKSRYGDWNLRRDTILSYEKTNKTTTIKAPKVKKHTVCVLK